MAAAADRCRIAAGTSEPPVIVLQGVADAWQVSHSEPFGGVLRDHEAGLNSAGVSADGQSDQGGRGPVWVVR
jgi:hypothetical protein